MYTCTHTHHSYPLPLPHPSSSLPHPPSLPQLEGMERPRTKGKEHSYVELEEDENVVEKYTRAMESIANVLQLDQLKQVGGVSGRG